MEYPAKMRFLARLVPPNGKLRVSVPISKSGIRYEKKKSITRLYRVPDLVQNDMLDAVITVVL